MQVLPESPQSHVCEVLQYLYVLEAHLQTPGQRIPPDVQALELVAGAKGRAWRAVETLRAARQAGQGPQPIAPWWYRVRRFARRSGVVGGALALVLGLSGAAFCGDNLSAGWRRLIASPYVQDTLRPILGGTLPVLRQVNRPLGVAADVRARTIFPDTVRLYGNTADEYVLTHELGHVFDNREIATDVVDSVTLDTHARPGTYAATAPQEHVAEAFERAVRSMRHGFADSLAVEQDVPGALLFIHWLRGQVFP